MKLEPGDVVSAKRPRWHGGRAVVVDRDLDQILVDYDDWAIGRHEREWIEVDELTLVARSNECHECRSTALKGGPDTDWKSCAFCGAEWRSVL